MGSCCSSGGRSGSGEEAVASHGVEIRPRRVCPSDEDGRPCVGERDVDNKAEIYIAEFHRHQSGECDCADQQQQATAAAAT